MSGSDATPSPLTPDADMIIQQPSATDPTTEGTEQPEVQVLPLIEDPLSVSQRLEVLSERVRQRVCRGLKPEAHKVMAQVLDTLTDVDIDVNPQVLRNLDIAIAALEREPADIPLAQQIISDSHRLLGLRRRRSRQKYSPAVLIVSGLCTLVYGFAPIAFIGFNMLRDYFALDKAMGVPLYYLLLVAFAGALGSSVSILVRIGDFSHMTQVDPYVLFLTGFFKPVIGLSFALLVFAIVQAELIPLAANDPERQQFFILALGFVAGFSERFAKDVVRRAEETLG